MDTHASPATKMGSCQRWRCQRRGMALLLGGLLAVCGLPLATSYALDDPDLCFGLPTRGDTDGSGRIDLTDAMGLLQYLFLGEARPACPTNADADGNGTLDLTDAVRILAYLFVGGEPPVISQLTDFALQPRLLPLSPEREPDVLVEFASPEDAVVVPFYPVEIVGLTSCWAHAIAEDGTVRPLIQAEFEDAPLQPLYQVFGYNDPLPLGTYTIETGCRGPSGGEPARAVLRLVEAADFQPEVPDEPPPDPNVGLCQQDIDVCCQESDATYYCIAALNTPGVPPDPMCEGSDPSVEVALCNPNPAGEGGGAILNYPLNNYPRRHKGSVACNA